MPDLDSRSDRLVSRSARAGAGMMLAWSTTLPVSAGKLAANTASPNETSSARPAAVSQAPVVEGRRRMGRRSELDGRRRLGGIAGRELRHRLVRTEGGHRPQHARERLEFGVVGAHGLDVVAARHGDAVLGAFELRLQREEVLVRLEVGIVLADGEQPAERAGELALRVLELLQLLWIGKLRDVDLGLRGLGARLDNGSQHILL